MPPTPKPPRLGYVEKREWEQMEKSILVAERYLTACQESAADPRVAADHKAVRARLETLAAAQAKVDELYARWASLEAKVKA